MKTQIPVVDGVLCYDVSAERRPLIIIVDAPENLSIYEQKQLGESAQNLSDCVSKILGYNIPVVVTKNGTNISVIEEPEAA